MVFQNFLLSLVDSDMKNCLLAHLNICVTLFLVFLYFIKMLVLDVQIFLAFLNKQLRLRICLMIFLVNHGCLPVLLGRYLCGIHSFIISRSLLVQSSVDSSTSSVSRPSQSVCSMRLLALAEFASLYIHTSLELEYLVAFFLQVLTLTTRETPKWSDVDKGGIVEQLCRVVMSDNSARSIRVSLPLGLTWVYERTTCISE